MADTLALPGPAAPTPPPPPAAAPAGGFDDAGPLRRAGWTLAAYLAVCRMWVRSARAYPVAFWVDLAGNALMSGVDFGVIAIMFLHTSELGGFTMPEIALLYGSAGLALGLADLIGGGVEQLGDRVRDGSMDAMLIRPVPALAQLGADRFAVRRAGRVLQAGAVLGWGLAELPVPWTPARAVVLLAMVLCGTVVFGSVFVLGAAFQFVAADAAEVQNAFTYGGMTLLQYPPGIYPKELVRGLMFVVPLGFVNWMPVLYLLGRPAPLGLPGWVRLLFPLAALACAAVAGLAWRAGLRAYRSTGS